VRNPATDTSPMVGCVKTVHGPARIEKVGMAEVHVVVAARAARDVAFKTPVAGRAVGFPVQAVQENIAGRAGM